VCRKPISEEEEKGNASNTNEEEKGIPSLIF
jgi:hypothetical protein